jgi:hypothetical protein
LASGSRDDDEWLVHINSLAAVSCWLHLACRGISPRTIAARKLSGDFPFGQRVGFNPTRQEILQARRQPKTSCPPAVHLAVKRKAAIARGRAGQFMVERRK